MIIPGFGVRDSDFVATLDFDGQVMFRCFGDNNHCFVRDHIGERCGCGKRIIKADGIFDAVIM